MKTPSKNNSGLVIGTKVGWSVESKYEAKIRSGVVMMCDEKANGAMSL
jgi:hypothetical protein